MIRLTPALAGFVVLAIGAAASADLQPHPLFSEGAVLQHGTTVPIWGTADEGERVTVAFQGKQASTTTDDGRWLVRLGGLEAGGPFDLVIRTEDETLTIGNVMVGEVWICSGQSNMQWPVQRSADSEATIANSADDRLRLLTVPRQGTGEPLETVDVEWVECGPETVPGFSAVGYHFGKRLREELDAPIGLISSNYGGTPAEAWTDPEALASHPELKAILERPRPEREQHRPGWLFNAMIEPLIPYAFKGVIWYQGEANARRAYEYRTLFPAMIESWRAAWGQGDFPFLFVQLAPFMKIEEEPTESAWAELREAQLLTAQTAPSTAMAVITDVGEEDDIHPRQKQPVGERLALAALALAYEREVPYSGPVLEEARFENGKAILTFDHVHGGLVARDGSLTGFTIAGEDRVFHNAQAAITGPDTIEVHSPEVEEPVAARFGWANYPVVNLWNEAGLPASPFRTDDWPGVTWPEEDADND